MKHKKNKGTIYWDESSRGTKYKREPGRWVGERLENGKRVRMRSTDYNKVVDWINQTPSLKGMPIIGLSDYRIDPKKGILYGKRGLPLKYDMKGNVKWYSLVVHGKPARYSFNRLAYGALHNINPRLIPQDLVIEYINGQYILKTKTDFFTEKCLTKPDKKKMTAILRKYKAEILLLQQYYEKGESEELEGYILNQLEPLVNHIQNSSYKTNLQRATDVALEAIEQYRTGIITGTMTSTNITSALRFMCHKKLTRNNKVEYNDDLMYKNL